MSLNQLFQRLKFNTPAAIPTVSSTSSELIKLENSISRIYSLSDHEKILPVVYITDMTGKKTQLTNVNEDWTVLQLKKAFGIEKGIGPEYIKLIYKAVQLKDTYQLNHYKLENECVIISVVRSNGGQVNYSTL